MHGPVRLRDVQQVFLFIFCSGLSCHPCCDGIFKLAKSQHVIHGTRMGHFAKQSERTAARHTPIPIYAPWLSQQEQSWPTKSAREHTTPSSNHDPTNHADATHSRTAVAQLFRRY